MSDDLCNARAAVQHSKEVVERIRRERAIADRRLAPVVARLRQACGRG